MSQFDNPDIYKAALLILGSEILSGRTVDANTPWIAERLTERGILLVEVRIIPDLAELIISSVNELRVKYDYVFTTGGIGPTHDDITAQCVADAFGVRLVRNDEAYAMLEKHYGPDELTPARARMALIPEGAALIPNPVSGAPGFICGNVHVMAGVPRIMQSMMDHVLDEIKAGKPILSNSVSCSLAESQVAEDLSKLQDRYPDIDIGSYPHYRGGVVGLSLVLRGTHNDQLDLATGEVIGIIKKYGDMPRTISIRSTGRALEALEALE